MYFGDSTVLITESDKVISNICVFLSFLKLFVLLSGGCADEANGREELSFYIIICCLSQVSIPYPTDGHSLESTLCDRTVTGRQYF